MKSNFTALRLSLIAAFGLGIAALPAHARTANVISETRSDSAGSAAPAATPPRKVRYCIVGQVTGSRIPAKVCKTAKEWSAEGVDVQKLK